MASPTIINDAVQGETFLPGQIFVFGGFELRANFKTPPKSNQNGDASAAQNRASITTAPIQTQR